jgi:uncharacterized protein (TIGR03083 family)
METDPAPWLAALRHSHETLQALVDPLDVAQLQGRSYCSEWSIAQVLSHLGSQAEIFGLFVDAGLSGQDPPGREEFGPIWDAWNGREPSAQAADALAADLATLEKFESLDDEQRDHLHLDLFGMKLDTTGMARMRLGEHAIHTWDIGVALHPGTTLAADATALLVDTIDQMVGRMGKTDGMTTRIRISTTSPERRFILELGENAALTPVGSEDVDADVPELRLPAESLIRLVYGRLDAEHTPSFEARGVELDELRRTFPGF